MISLKILSHHNSPLEGFLIKRLDIEAVVGIEEARDASCCRTPWIRDDTQGKLLVLGVDDDQLLRLPALPALPCEPGGGGVKVGHCVKVTVEVGGGCLQLREALAAGHVGAVTQLSSDPVLDAVVKLKTAKVNIFHHLVRMSVFFIVRFMTFGTFTSLTKKNFDR